MANSIVIEHRRGPAPEMVWLATGVGMAVLPHTFHIPFWASFVFICLLFLRLAISDRSINRFFIAGFLFRLTIGAIIFSGVFMTYGTMVGRDAGVTLLVLLGGMKLIEIKSERDYYISTFIGFLLILTNFFYTQVLAVSIYLFATLVVLVAALISINDRHSTLNLKSRLKESTTLFIHALPLMVIMFLLFPRVNGPLWGLPKDAQSGLTGIDDEMSPGSISQLILSDDVAFRVSFEDDIPPKSSLYWRGPVLWYTDGFKWVPDRPRDAETRIIAETEAVNYTVTMEASDKRWLFALDIPSKEVTNSYFSHDMQLRTKRPVLKRTRYEASSYIDYVLLSDNKEDLEYALQLPGNYHPKTIALARSWREQGLSDIQIVEKALNHFNQQTFYYTLAPPVLLDDPVDEFLFESREGFCEHYAAAFTVLMRAAGIPARVVTGYQGGTINPVGRYLIVYQRDAHAWTEVWLGEDRGWVRVDPTSAVSPSRVTDGIESALPESLINIPPGIFNNTFSRNLWERMNNTVDAINNRWNQWVLGYDRNRQTFLLNRIGFGDIDSEGLLTGLIFLIIACMLIISLTLFHQAAKHYDSARHWYDKFRKRLMRAGIRIYDHEGPRDLATRAGRLRTDLKEAIYGITDRYIGIRYNNHIEDLESLKYLVRNFKPDKVMQRGSP
jgi:transglutaminase-like putative cysteine protease